MAKLSIKKFLPRSLLGRSLLILVIPVVLIQVITTHAFFDRHWNRMNTRLAYALSGEISMLVALAKDGGLSEKVIDQISTRYLDLAVEIYPKGQLPDRTNLSKGPIWETDMAKRLRAELSAQLAEPFVIHTKNDNNDIIVFVRAGEGLVKVSFPQRRLFSSSGYVFLLWVLGSSLILLLVAILFMRNQIRPIRKLAVAAERFGKGRDTPSFKPEGAAEVRQAAHAFLDMRRRIQRQITQRTEMLAGVSHDLRTPLTRMKLQLEMMPDNPDVRELKGDVLDMQKMVQGYLDFVRGDGDENFAALELGGLLEKLATGLRRDNVEVEMVLEPDIRMIVRPLAFERALGNVLNNAGKYGQKVWVKAFTEDKKLQIQIEDNGPGIPPDMLEEVFKPFIRVDESRNSDTGGVGLGLPIAMDIIMAHGGRIVLSQSSYGGLCATIRMPL